jgi:SAM-dependent MidA family methyltransferase
MFGEMVGACLGDAWKRAGAPSDAIYVELGPGRGTLSSDALRVLRKSGFAGEVHFVETSPVLRQAQKEAVPNAVSHETVEEIPARPLLLVANEFLDALPIRQFVGALERRVVVAAGGLAFDRDGEIVELSPARDEAVASIAICIAQKGGAALFIDYGHGKSSPGDTLQAVRGHRFSPVLESPGEQDLTAHVDFEAVAREAIEAGAAVTPLVSQGEWLTRLGIKARGQALSSANPERRLEIDEAIERLVAPDKMGSLFKVLALHSANWPSPAGF